MRALVTGATGFLGQYLVRALLARGDSVRILARSAQRAAPLAGAGAEVRVGDLAEPATLSGIATGIDVVFHLARSVTEGSDALFERMDVQGTAAILAEAQACGVRRFVYVSTLAGFALPRMPDNALIDERCPLDDSGDLGRYVRAKARAERLVIETNGRGELETVIVRLGLVCGVGTPVLPAHVCLAVSPKWVLLFGDGGVPLPLTYVDNAVEALLLAAGTAGIGGEIFHIVDPDPLTQREYLGLLQQVSGGAPRVVRLPRLSYYGLGLLTEILAAARHRSPATNRYRIRARLRRVRWDCTKAVRQLHWRAGVPLREGLVRTFRAQGRP